MKKILVFKIGALGDILMATPFLRELRSQNKDAKIDFLVGDNCEVILKGNAYISSTLPFDHTIFTKKKLRKFIQLMQNIRRKKYDKIYVLDKHWVFHLFAYLTGIKVRVGLVRDVLGKFFSTEFVVRKQVKHEIDYYLFLLTISNTKKISKKLYFGVAKKYEEKVKNYLSRNKLSKFIIFVNLGGNDVELSDVRRLPDSKFKELLKELSKKHKVLLVGGPNDKTYYSSFLLNDNCYNTAGEFSIGETIFLMRKAQHVYSTDCGPMHMAACVNDNITTFFGPTNPLRKAPLVKHVKNIWKDKDIYEEEYELSGKLPDKNKRFFTKLSVKDL